jgi:PTS system nitrogen regulatory IIA component
MDLADILNEESILVCTDISAKAELLEVMSAHAAVVTGHDRAAIHAAVVEREELGSTGLGNGIAIPHGKLAGLAGVRAVFARLTTPIEFDAVDDQKVDLVMLLLAPLGSGADHLKALARVARLLRTETVVEELRATTDPARLYAILTRPVSASRAA